MSNLRLTPIAADSRAPLIALARQTYLETFAYMGYYTPAIVTGYLDTSFAEDKISAELAHPDHYFYFLTPDGESDPVGYLKLVSGKPLPAPEPVLNSPVYLERLYILQTAQGQGYGRQSLAFAELQAQSLGGQSLWLTVWEYNAPAIGFYEKTGWTRVGTTTFPFVSEGVSYVDTDLLYVKNLQ